MMNHGYVREYVEDADKLIINGDTSGFWQDDPSMIVHPEAGKWLIGLGEQVFGLDPTGWRIPSVDRRLADGPGDGPARTPAHRLDRPGLRRRACCSASTASTSCCRGWRCSTSSSRSSPSARSTASSPTAPGSAPGWPGSRPEPVTSGFGPVRGAALAAVAGARRRLLRPRRRHQVERPLRAGRLRHPGLGLERRRPPVVRRPVVDWPGRPSSTAYPPSSTSCSSASSSTSRPGPAGWSTPRSTSRPSPTRSTRSTTAASRGRPATSRTRPGVGEVTQSLRSLARYHQRRLRLPHPLPRRLRPHLRVAADRLAAARPRRGRRRRHRHPARASQGCEAPTGSDCLRQVHPARHARAVVGLGPGAARVGGVLGRPARLALRRTRRRYGGHLAAVAGQRRPPDLPVLRRDDGAVPWSSPRRW